jgi:hypothetical protein
LDSRLCEDFPKRKHFYVWNRKVFPTLNKAQNSNSSRPSISEGRSRPSVRPSSPTNETLTLLWQSRSTAMASAWIGSGFSFLSGKAPRISRLLLVPFRNSLCSREEPQENTACFSLLCLGDLSICFDFQHHSGRKSRSAYLKRELLLASKRNSLIAVWNPFRLLPKQSLEMLLWVLELLHIGLG